MNDGKICLTLLLPVTSMNYILDWANFPASPMRHHFFSFPFSSFLCFFFFFVPCKNNLIYWIWCIANKVHIHRTKTSYMKISNMLSFLLFISPLQWSLWRGCIQSKVGVEVHLEWSEMRKQLIVLIIHFTDIWASALHTLGKLCSKIVNNHCPCGSHIVVRGKMANKDK